MDVEKYRPTHLPIRRDLKIIHLHGVYVQSKMASKWFQIFSPFCKKKRLKFAIHFYSNFTSMRYKQYFRNVWRDIIMSGLANVALKSSNGICCKN